MPRPAATRRSPPSTRAGRRLERVAAAAAAESPPRFLAELAEHARPGRAPRGRAMAEDAPGVISAARHRRRRATWPLPAASPNDDPPLPVATVAGHRGPLRTIGPLARRKTTAKAKARRMRPGTHTTSGTWRSRRRFTRDDVLALRSARSRSEDVGRAPSAVTRSPGRRALAHTDRPYAVARPAPRCARRVPITRLP